MSEVAKDRAGLLYACFYGGQFILLGVQLPFLAGWFLTKGFSATDIGWITGFSLIARLTLGPAVAYWADHQMDERRPLRYVSALFALGALMIALTPHKVLIASGAVLTLWTFGLLVPLTDTAALRADRNGRLNYGRTRAIGSAFFLITNIIGGFLVAASGLDMVVWIMAFAAAATFILSIYLPHGAGGRDGERPMSWREAPKLVANKTFIIAVSCAGLIQGAHAVYYAFSYIRWAALGYSEIAIGFLWATGVIAEIFVLTRARALARSIHPAILLAIGAGAAALRWSLTALEPPLWALFLIQALHALTFAAAYLGALEFMMRAAPVRLVNTGMTLMSATGVGAVTGIATVGAGYIWEIYGPAAAYGVMSAMGAIALILALALKRIWNGERIFD